jgi:phosphoribosylformimino-5-aminoimidazole carboxamide ribotide isomerase
MKFRPCIDLHNGIVKQIIGSTLTVSSDVEPTENFVANIAASEYSKQYKHDKLYGGHIIMLGPGCESAALLALNEFHGGMQVGGISF